MQNMVIEDQQIPGNERQNFILNAFDLLDSGCSITILSHYDPIYIWKQFNENRPLQFTLKYLVEGPNVWKIKLTKKLKEDWIPLH